MRKVNLSINGERVPDDDPTARIFNEVFNDMSTHKQCSVCEGIEHHWLPYSDPEWTGYVCKHCPARTQAEVEEEPCECKDWASFDSPVGGVNLHHSMCDARERRERRPHSRLD